MVYSIYSTVKNKVCFQEVKMSLDEGPVHQCMLLSVPINGCFRISQMPLVTIRRFSK